MHLDRDELMLLAAGAKPPCVSILLPMSPREPHTDKDLIRIKNSLRKAEKELLERGHAPAFVVEFLGPAMWLLEDRSLLRERADGLAVFISREQTRFYPVPISLDELVVVGERFHLKPLVPLLTGGGRYHVLALSAQRVRLLEGRRDLAVEVDLGEAPRSLVEAVGHELDEQSLQFHTRASSPSAGERPAVFHGQGRGKDDVDRELALFLRRVDEQVCRILQPPETPLVLAGVERIASAYRSLSRYPRLLEVAVEGNPDELSARELAVRAFPLVQPSFRAELERALTRYAEARHTSRTSDELEALLPAARDARIDTLFVAADQQLWGSYDTWTKRVELHEGAGPRDQDLLDLLSTETLVGGGTVYVLPRGELPTDAPAAAIFRYPLDQA